MKVIPRKKQLMTGLIAFAATIVCFIFPPALLAIPIWLIHRGVVRYRENHRPMTAREARECELAARAKWLKESGLG